MTKSPISIQSAFLGHGPRWRTASGPTKRASRASRARLGGARALGLDGGFGYKEKGRCADLVVLTPPGPHAHPGAAVLFPRIVNRPRVSVVPRVVVEAPVVERGGVQKTADTKEIC